MELLAAHHTPADMAALEDLQRQAEEAAAQDTAAFAEALFRYHRGVTFLSGNTITPLIFNAFTQVNLEFWREYVEAYGVEACLDTLHRFTELIRERQGAEAAALLKNGLERFQQDRV